MLSGSTVVRIEKQGRFKLPRTVARALADARLGPSLFVTTILDGRVFLYPMQQYHRLMEEADRGTDPDLVELVGVMNANGSVTEIDASERVAIPSRVRQLSESEDGFEAPGDALLVGDRDHLELRFELGPARLSGRVRGALHRLRIAPMTPPQTDGDR